MPEPKRNFQYVRANIAHGFPSVFKVVEFDEDLEMYKLWTGATDSDGSFATVDLKLSEFEILREPVLDRNFQGFFYQVDTKHSPGIQALIGNTVTSYKPYCSCGWGEVPSTVQSRATRFMIEHVEKMQKWNSK